MNYGRAFLAGVVGGAVMSVLMALGRMMGMQINLEMMLGSMVTASMSTGVWILGLVMHLIISGLIALAYAAGFEYVTHRADWMIGVAFAIIHILIAGVVVGMAASMHPLIPQQIPAPGMFMANMGTMGVIAFIMLHLIYGGIVGAMYQSAQTTRAYGTGANS